MVRYFNGDFWLLSHLFHTCDVIPKIFNGNAHVVHAFSPLNIPFYPLVFITLGHNIIDIWPAIAPRLREPTPAEFEPTCILEEVLPLTVSVRRDLFLYFQTWILIFLTLIITLRGLGSSSASWLAARCYGRHLCPYQLRALALSSVQNLDLTFAPFIPIYFSVA